MKPKVVLITTGGTIAMRHDPVRGGDVPAVSGPELIDAVPPLAGLAAIEVVEFANIPSPHMTPQHMRALGDEVEKKLLDPAVAGVVVTHGTDTLEETAYFLDLYVRSEKPVCFTAAMRGAGAVSPDGPGNILRAVRCAASPIARGKGTLVVMNEEIHAARDVAKTHSANPKTFASPFWGPLGYVDEDTVLFRREPVSRQTIHPETPEYDVHLVRLAAGSDDFLLHCLIDRGVQGIVIEGFGRGNVPPATLPGIQRAVTANIPIVLATRCAGGRVLDVYAYEGGVRGLVGMGVIPGGEISGHKARIKLMLALGETRSRERLAACFATE